MIIYLNESTDPYFNLAGEEYMLGRHMDDTIFMLWRNESAVIIGRNQNAYAELNIPYITENDIKVTRRLTGGGAVFHDLGNVNFTFILPWGEGDTLDFARFTSPVIDALGKLGISASASGRNDIVIDGQKISGNAQCVYNGRIMHHGTLLYSADMSKLSGALRVNPEKIRSKGVSSVRARVTNIAEHMNVPLDVCEFMERLRESFEGEVIPMSEEDIAAIGELARRKYSTFDWVYGESKSFSRESSSYTQSGLVSVALSSEHGIITDLRISGDFFGRRDIAELEHKLIGHPLEMAEILKICENSGDYIMNMPPQRLAEMFFE